MKDKILSLFKKKIILLDGAIGTELEKSGMPSGVCPEIWCIENNKLLSKIHSAYSLAGSDIIYTATFGANRIKLSLYNVKDVIEINRKLALLARKSSINSLVAGDIGPLGKFIKPFGELEFEEAVNIFKEQIKGLLLGKVDLFVIETMMDIQEARAALLAVKEMTDKFTIVTLTFQKDGRTLLGNDPISALITLQSHGADAFGCNCSTGPQDMIKIISLMKPYANIPLVAKPNAGLPSVLGDKTVFNMDVGEFAFFGRKLVLAGAHFVGGCCGSSPEHIRVLKNSVENLKPIILKKKSISIATSAKNFVVFGDNSFTVIGEKINPTGRKKLQKELKKGIFTELRDLAKEQEKNGAKLLDVNVAVEGSCEEELMLKAISVLVNIVNLPLVIDSSNIKTIELALRFYPGRAIVNSVSFNTNTKKLLSIIKKYGAMGIILPITSKGIPDTFKERKRIIKKILKCIEKIGYDKKNFLIDALVMAISSNPNSAIEALKTIKWCKNTLKCNTIIGLSNISFAMPARSIINKTFLTLAKKEGLSSAICDPKDNKSIRNKFAEDLLLGKDKSAKRFIAHYSKIKYANIKKSSSKISSTIEDKLFNAIVNGEKEAIIDTLKEALLKFSPYELLNSYMIPAIVRVGELFENKKYFLPQLILSAETFKKAIRYLEPLLKREEIDKIKRGKVLLATVKDDIHDIGKNIVALLLRNYGFEVIDMGKDVPGEKIIRAIEKYCPDVVGLSALMTTTMLNMKKVILLANKKGLTSKFILGGAVVNRSFASSLGAAYAKDAVSGVKIIQKLIKS